MMKYCGVGSRQTPADIVETMTKLGKRLAEKGWLLRSGGADGADMAFEVGCDQATGQKQIFLPWKKFNGNQSLLHDPSEAAKALAATIHPAWENCNDAAKRLHARNCHQVLGPNLDDPVDIIICWTLAGKTFGGTATAINLGIKNGIPVLNLAVDKDIKTAILSVEAKDSSSQT